MIFLFDFYHSFDPNPLKRHTFWTITVGGSIMWVSIYSINQSQVQRYISCKTLGHAKMWVFLQFHTNPSSPPHTHTLRNLLSSTRSLYLNMVGLWVTVSLAMFSGLTMYSIYKNCDPLGNGDVSTSDQVRDAAASLFFYFVRSTSSYVM